MISATIAPASDAAEAPRDANERKALWFTAAIMAVSLGLQRFGVPFGGKALSIVGPLGFGLVFYGLAAGALSLHRIRLIVYLGLVLLVFLGMAWHTAAPAVTFAGGANINSLAQFLLLTSFAVFTFAIPVNEAAFFRTVTFAFMLVAVAGIVQFFAQFAGLKVFAFTGLLPDAILYEAGYNLAISAGIGDITKSNGFVLVEPSVFSQLMAVALIIEATGVRRLPYLGVFLAGLLLSFSGTGWLVIAAFIVGSAVGMGLRGLAVAGGVVVGLAATVLLAAWLAPSFVNALGSRMSEINQPGTSGHFRFITPFWLLGDVLAIDSSALLLGVGSGGSDRLRVPYDYAMNTPVKVMMDYGAPALVAYALLFVLGRKTPMQAALVLPTVVMFMFAGGYQQFPPMIFIVLLLTTVASLRRSG